MNDLIVKNVKKLRTTCTIKSKVYYTYKVYLYIQITIYQNQINNKLTTIHMDRYIL